MLWIVGAGITVACVWALCRYRPVDGYQVQRLGRCYRVNLHYSDGDTDHFIGEGGEWYEYPSGRTCSGLAARRLTRMVKDVENKDRGEAATDVT
jgi:hypothetical protein